MLVNQYIFQSITALYFLNKPIKIHFLFSSDWSIQISGPLIGQNPKENIRPRPGEHPVFTLLGQSKTAFAFPSTNHRQTETTFANSTTSNNPTSPYPIHPLSLLHPPSTTSFLSPRRPASDGVTTGSPPPCLGRVATPGKNRSTLLTTSNRKTTRKN